MRPFSTSFFSTDNTKRGFVFLSPSFLMFKNFVSVFVFPFSLRLANNGRVCFYPFSINLVNFLSIMFGILFLPNIALGFGVTVSAPTMCSMRDFISPATVTRNKIVFLRPHVEKYNKNFCGRYSLVDRKSTRLNSSHTDISRMPSSA